jgi:hypothetical protein
MRSFDRALYCHARALVGGVLTEPSCCGFGILNFDPAPSIDALDAIKGSKVGVKSGINKSIFPMMRFNLKCLNFFGHLSHQELGLMLNFFPQLKLQLMYHLSSSVKKIGMNIILLRL